MPATGLLAAKVLRPATGLSFLKYWACRFKRSVEYAPLPSGNAASVCVSVRWTEAVICFFTAFHSSIAAGGVGVLRCPRKNYREKKCRITWRSGHGGHMVCSLFRKRDGTYRGTKICMALKLRSHTRHVSSFWTAGLHESNGYLGW